MVEDSLEVWYNFLKKMINIVEKLNFGYFLIFYGK